MDTTEKKVFRKSFMGGFSKKDVNAYIEEFASRSTSRIEELEKRLLTAEEEKASVAASLSQAEEKISELEKSKEELLSVSEKLAALSEKYDSLTAAFSEKSDEATRLSSENTEMSAKIAFLSGIEAEYTARKAELADIEISARGRASEILSDAEREISARRAALDCELSERERRFEESRAESLREASDAVSGMTRLVASLRAEVESMDSRLVRIAEGARNNLSTLSNSVSDAGEKISKIGEALQSLND